KCMKCFPTASFGEKPDYSGYNTLTWPHHDIKVHRQMSLNHLNACTKSQQKIIKKEHGIRYSALIDLPYFNPIKYTVIDPMHNLFLGTSKHCMEIWTKYNIVTKSDLEVIEERMLCLKAPHSIGRLPLKIGSGFSGFTADQWQKWTTFYSSIALRGTHQHLQYWLLFVKACCLLCNHFLQNSNIELAHKYLQMFCTKYEEINGKEACTPNMHLHFHLVDCLENYGPVYALWCFAFEKYNGNLGSFPTN
uniref:DUF4218 domain-containing protein n=1 Tax=Amphimedon queenslandica TaxID=400682 RepID=A0A1X7U5P6_AMPQE